MTAPTLVALDSALVPVDQLRGEHSQLEDSVRESFAAIETLHTELSQWQQELVRQQEALDQRVAALALENASSGSTVDELASLLEAERKRAADERRLWLGELRGIRRLLSRQESMLTSLGASSPVEGDEDEEVELSMDVLEELGDPTDVDSPDADLNGRSPNRRSRRRAP
ncbi:MAG TPA: hypothetical protein PJ982_01020 [Lacipirellulaceae bacterium]|nr:hypothetical protein [Lacipirellulaceae bacterium]